MKENKPKIVGSSRTTVRLDVDAHRLAKMASAGDGVSLQGWVSEAVRLRLNSPKIATTSGVNRATIDQHWHAVLDAVLADQEERGGIEKNLQWAEIAIRTKSPKPPAPTKKARAS